jgi:hypothetical protein
MRCIIARRSTADRLRDRREQHYTAGSKMAEAQTWREKKQDKLSQLYDGSGSEHDHSRMSHVDRVLARRKMVRAPRWRIITTVVRCPTELTVDMLGRSGKRGDRKMKSQAGGARLEGASGVRRMGARVAARVGDTSNPVVRATRGMTGKTLAPSRSRHWQAW